MTQHTSSARRVERRRDKLRAQGLRPLQIWVRDTRAPGFAEEALRQGRLVGASYEGADKELIEFWERIADDSADAWR
jgi:Protein  of unknown function (DUF3018)